jgi:cytoskeletal protein CcmA (bactofilin family)
MSSTGGTSFAVPRQVPGASETVVGSNTRCVGTLRSTGCVHIDGALEGTLAVAGTLIIGETGRVNATITAQNGHVAGAVTGTITIVEQLELAPTGTIQGHIIGAITVIQPPGRSPAGRIWDHIRTAAWPIEQGSAHILAVLQGMHKDGNEQGHRGRYLSLRQVERQALLEHWARSFALVTATILTSVLLGIAVVVLLTLVER